MYQNNTGVKIIKQLMVFLLLAAVVLSAGCASVSGQLVYGTGGVGWKEALAGLDDSSAEERLYIARDLKAAFMTESDDNYRMRAAYGLLRIAVLQAKDDEPESSLDLLTFLHTRAAFKTGESREGNISEKITPQFLNTLAAVLPGTVKLRHDERWVFMKNFYDELKKTNRAKANKWQAYVIKEAGALNSLDKVYEEASYRGIAETVKENPGTRTAVLAKKMAFIVKKEKAKSKNIEEKYLIINSGPLAKLYEEQKEAIEKIIYEMGPKTLKGN